MVITSDFIDINTSKERTEQALEGLEKLKSIIYLVESRYNILESDYTTMLDDAISRVQALKLELDKLSSVHTVDKNSHTEEDLPEKILFNRLFEISPDQITRSLSAQKEKRQEVAGRLQSIVDAIGDAIELGLDKIGDGIMFPVVNLMKLVHTIKKS